MGRSWAPIWGSRKLVSALVAGATIALCCLGAVAASGAPFVQGESLERCGGGGLALSGEGTTAISGRCVYVGSGGTWTKQAELPLPEGKRDYYSISDDGNTLLVSNESDDNLVLVRSGASWEEQASLPAGNAALSSEGNTALVSSDRGSGPNEVIVFTRSAGIWTEQGKLTITPTQKGKKGEAEAHDFGYPLSLSADGDTALVGDSAAAKAKGGVFVFARSGESWSQQAALSGGKSSKGKEVFGERAALSAEGSIALVTGAYNSGKKGSAWAFQRTGTEWTEKGSAFAPAKLKPYSFFGYTMALAGDGETALIHEGNTEHSPSLTESVYVYTRSGESWTSTESIPEPLEARYFGSEGIAISEDGETALISNEDHPFEPGSTTTWSR